MTKTKNRRQQSTDAITTIRQIGKNLKVLALDVEKQKEEVNEIKSQHTTEYVTDIESHPKIIQWQTQLDCLNINPEQSTTDIENHPIIINLQYQIDDLKSHSTSHNDVRGETREEVIMMM